MKTAGVTREDWLAQLEAGTCVTHFEPRPLAPEVLEHILEAGCQTALPWNLQPWQFVLATEAAAREKLLQHCVDPGPAATALGVTPTYMAKIVQSLTRVGLLRAVRGPGGGVKLGRPARDIRLWDVISAIEPVGDFEYCLLGLNRCSDVDSCPVHEHWKAMRQVLLEKLQTETLWDFASSMAGKGLVREQELTPAG